MKGCKHKWEDIAESCYSINEWCTRCGAWRRYDKEHGKTTIYHPQNQYDKTNPSRA